MVSELVEAEINEIEEYIESCTSVKRVWDDNELIRDDLEEDPDRIVVVVHDDKNAVHQHMRSRFGKDEAALVVVASDRDGEEFVRDPPGDVIVFYIEETLSERGFEPNVEL